MENFSQAGSLRSTFKLLQYTFVILPMGAGADKFMHLLTDWDKYLNPDIAALLPFSGAVFMKIAGVIEIIAGILVLLRPRTGGYVVSAWLLAIALTLLAGGMFLDVAVRDIVMAIAAFAMARLVKFAD